MGIQSAAAVLSRDDACLQSGRGALSQSKDNSGGPANLLSFAVVAQRGVDGKTVAEVEPRR